jgi:lysophospholipase L1-like esterase
VSGRLRNVIVACAALACVQCSSHHWPVVRNASARHSIVVFGDSLALGVGASTPDRGFVNLLLGQMRTADPGATLANFAVSGALVQDVSNDQLARARDAGATDVWLCVGGNDVTHGTTTDQFSSTEHSLVAAIRAAWPQAHIVVFGVPDVSRSPMLPGIAKIKLHNDAALDDDAAMDAARAGAADFVDLFAFSDRELDVSEDFSPDAFHPNDRGYAAIAAFAAKVVM